MAMVVKKVFRGEKKVFLVYLSKYKDKVKVYSEKNPTCTEKTPKKDLEKYPKIGKGLLRGFYRKLY